MLCGGFKKRKRCDINDSKELLENSPNLKGRSLLSPLKSLELSPIPRSQGVKRVKEDIQPMSLKGRGQLKLSIYVNSGLMTIHVIQAKHLKSSTDQTCASFVRVSLVPDDLKSSRCKTDLICDTNSPVYDQKFSYELNDYDRKRRLLLSVWHRNSKQDQNEFLGCMSFGVKSILSRSRTVAGWYYLLTEQVGRRKHLQAFSSRQHLVEKTGTNIPAINKDLCNMEHHTAVIRRCEFGYGFTVMGSCPAQIGRVDTGLPAEEAGLQNEDCIIRLNGINVSRSCAESVAKIIKHSEFIAMEVQRPFPVSPEDDSLKKPLSSTLCQSSHHANLLSHDSEQKENEAPFRHPRGMRRHPSGASVRRPSSMHV